MMFGIRRKDSMKTTSSDISSGGASLLAEENHPYYVQSPSWSSHRPHSIELSISTVAEHEHEHEHPWNNGETAASRWEKINLDVEEEEEEELQGDEFGGDIDDGEGVTNKWQDYLAALWFVARVVAVFVVAFTMVAVILWGVSRSYKPRVLVQEMVFRELSIEPGQDRTGVPTEMISLKSKVKVLYRKPATFFGVHVSSTPFVLHHYGLQVATGKMVKLYQSKKSEETISTVVMHGHRKPLYGALLALKGAKMGNRIDKHKVKIGLNLTFTLRTRANVMGKLVTMKLFTTIICPVTLNGARLRVPINLKHSCIYQ